MMRLAEELTLLAAGALIVVLLEVGAYYALPQLGADPCAVIGGYSPALAPTPALKPQ
ncbi:MAG TPA: hypothetical protein VFA23_04370 [Dongiaceae bacterium]|nr:hypothetical protein [Dongiaceae bacterium]